MLRISLSTTHFSNRLSSRFFDNYNSFCTLNHKSDKNNYNRNRRANNINTYDRFINFINFENLKTKNYIDYDNQKVDNVLLKNNFAKTESIGIKSSTESTSSYSSDSLSSSPTSSAFSISPNSSNNYVSSSSSSSNKPKQCFLVKSQSICLSKQSSFQTKPSNITKSNSVRKYDPRTVQKSLLEWCQIKTKNYQVIKI
jgi:hypothetical protein